MRSFDLKKAVERLIWRIKPDDKGKQKTFNPNEDDFKALKVVVEWIDRQKRESVANNQLFAKLYVYFLCDIIRKYETTIFDEIPQKELSRMLDLPLGYFYKAFENDLFQNQFQKFIKQGGADLNLKEFKEIYPSEYVWNMLNEMVSEAVNRFS